MIGEFDRLELPEKSGINIDSARMLELLHSLGAHYPSIPFTEKPSANGLYYYENPAFSYGDAIVLGGMIMQFRPKRIIEIGSGFSSAAMIDVNDRLFGGRIDLKFFDPYPEVVNKVIPKNSVYRQAVHQEAAQDIPISTFGALEANDILFIDSTHVSKMASDVNYLVLNVLPQLAAGVVIHIHDIPYPFEYPGDWIDKENRSWNEAYLLRAFLAFNTSFEILFFNHYATRKGYRQVA